MKGLAGSIIIAQIRHRAIAVEETVWLAHISGGNISVPLNHIISIQLREYDVEKFLLDRSWPIDGKVINPNSQPEFLGNHLVSVDSAIECVCQVLGAG